MVQEERGLYKEGDKNEAKSLFDEKNINKEKKLFDDKKGLSDEHPNDDSLKKSLFDGEDKIEEGSLSIKDENLLNEKKGISDEKLDDNSDETSLGEHPRLGKLIKVSVHPTNRVNKNSGIPASIGKYHFDITPGQEVVLPEKIIELLEQSMDTFGVFDPDAISEEGFKGVTITKEEPHYIIKKL